MSINQSKKEAFSRISTSRLEKAVKSIELLGNLASHNYESTTQERAAIIERILNEVSILSEKYGVSDLIQPNEERSKSEITPEVDNTHPKNQGTVEEKSPTVLKVLRDLEHGEMPLFASVLQESLISFAKKEPGSEKHLRQLLRISAISLSDV